jgi:HTH-like domain
VAAFIAAQRDRHGVPVALACRALGVSPAWFYKWRGGDVSLRRARRRALAELVRTLFARHRGRYGSPRIATELRELGWRVSVNTVARVTVLYRAARDLTSTTSLPRPSKARDQLWISRPLRSRVARICLSHSVPSLRPLGSWSPRSQRHAAIIASTRMRHWRSKSRLTPG